jgi:hypothetical protein
MRAPQRKRRRFKLICERDFMPLVERLWAAGLDGNFSIRPDPKRLCTVFEGDENVSAALILFQSEFPTEEITDTLE